MTSVSVTEGFGLHLPLAKPLFGTGGMTDKLWDLAGLLLEGGCGQAGEITMRLVFHVIARYRLLSVELSKTSANFLFRA